MHRKPFKTYILIMLTLITTEGVCTSRPEAALPQARDEDGVTALMRAARDGERDNIKALLEQGVDINSRDAYGWTALTYAAAKGDIEIVKALLAKGADLNARDEDDYTPLMASAAYGHTSIVRLLIDKGVNINQKDKNGTTALDIAARTHQNKVAELLKKAGAIETKPQAGASFVSSKTTVDTRPVLLNRPEPSYTMKARDKAIAGNVRVRVLVGSDGTVKKVRVLIGLPYGLSYQAIDAAYQLRFKPATKDGKPVEHWLPVEIEFRLRG
jgi:TonB family protein